MAQQDMLHGPLVGKILTFALPLAATSLLQQLYNTVDVAVVGHYTSSQALAAVGSNAPVINLIINLFVGVSLGANVVLANHIGQRNEQCVRRAVSTAVAVALVSGLVLIGLGSLLARPILESIGTPSDVIDLATLYLRIYFCGMPFIMAFNFGSAIMRSRGDTNHPLQCLAVASVINASLDFLFVRGLGMGVEGVALATVLANGVSATMLIGMLMREQGPFRIERKMPRAHWSELRKMLIIGIPAGIQGMVFSLSNVVIQKAINEFGSAAMAGSAASLNFEQFCYFFMSSFCGAAVTFVGQNYGAGQGLRCRKVFRICMMLALCTCVVLNVTLVLGRNLFIHIFTEDPAVISFASERMLTVLAFQWMACSYEVTGSALRGMGHSVMPAVMTIFGTCLLRLLWVWFVSPQFGTFQSIMFVYPISWAATGLMVGTAWWRMSRRLTDKGVAAASVA